MTTSTAAIQNLASAHFEGEVYGTLSAVARLAAAVTSRAQVTRLAWVLRNTNKSADALLNLVNDTLSGKRAIEQPREEVTPQRLQSLADTIDHLARIIEYQYELMRRAGLTNNSLTAAALKKMQGNIEPLKDLADWLDISSKPEEVKAILARGKEEHDRGESFNLNRVE